MKNHLRPQTNLQYPISNLQSLLSNIQHLTPIFLAPFLLLAPVLFTGKALFWGTPSLQFIPWWDYALDTLRSGHLPLWNPLVGMGAPLMANYQSALFYPPNWIYLLLGLLGGTPLMAWGMAFLVALHLLWAGLGMAALTRRLGLGRLAQTVAGLAFSLSGYLVARAGFLSINAAAAWLPWVLLFSLDIVIPSYFTDRVGTAFQRGIADKVQWNAVPLRSSGGKTLKVSELKTFRVSLLKLGLAIGLQLLAGHAQTTWYTLVLAGTWVTFWAWVRGDASGKLARWGQVLRAWARYAAAVLVGVGISAVQLLPTAEYLLQSQRSAAVDYELAMTYSFWPWRFLTLLAPDMFGNPAHGNYWGYGNFWEDAVYIGLLPLLLALTALYALRKRSHLPPPTSDLQPPASNLQPPTSHLPPPASNLQPPTSNTQPPASNLQPPTSNLQPPTSSLQPPTSNLQPPTSNLQPPTSNLQPPASNTQHPIPNTQYPIPNTQSSSLPVHCPLNTVHCSLITVYCLLITVFSFTFALGKNTPIFPWLYNHIPTFDMFQAPTRITLWAVFALALLAALGVDRWRRPRKRALYWTRLGTAGAFAISLGAGLAWYFMDDVRLTLIRASALAGLWALGTGVLALTAPHRDRKTWWQWGVVTWLMADLLVAGWGLNPGVSLDFYHPGESPTAGRIYLPAQDEYDLKFERFLTFETFSPGEDWDAMRAVHLPNLNMLDDVAMVNNFDPFVPGRFQRWMAALGEVEPAPWAEMLNLMGVSTMERVSTTGAWGVALTPWTDGAGEAPQPARWVGCAHQVDDGEAALAVVAGGEIDLHEAVTVESPPPPQTAECSAGKGEVRLAGRESPNKVSLHVKADQPGWVVWSEVWYPGWRARVDGERVTVARGDYLFQAIPVPEGEHEVGLVYRPVWFYVGAVVSAVTLIGVALLMKKKTRLL